MTHEVILLLHKDEGATRLLERILEGLATEGYPPHRPAEASRFVAGQNEVASFVYELDGEVVGHAAVHEYSARSVMAVASKGLCKSADNLSAVARLFVAPEGRRGGVGRTCWTMPQRRALTPACYPF